MKLIITPLLLLLSFQVIVAQTPRTGNFVANMPSIYPISGTVNVAKSGGDLVVTFEDDFSTVQGISLEVFLSVTGSLNTSTDVKISTAPLDEGTAMNSPISGMRTFIAPEGIGINDFDHVVVYCTSANVLWGNVSLSDSEKTWKVVDAGFGVKPSIALTSKGYPRIAYMSEISNGNGFIKLGLSKDTTFTSELADSGYFYGPLDIDIDSEDLTQIAYHDHNENGGELVVAVQNGQFDWDQVAVPSPGHDGWDATIYIDDNDESYVLGVHDGGDLEYSEMQNGQWVTEGVGLTGLKYMFATDIIVENNVAHMACFRSISDDLYYVTKENGSFSHEVVTTASMFPSMNLDETGTIRMAYYKRLTPTTGEVIVATRTNNGWTETIVDQLSGIDISFGGARNIVDLERYNGNMYLTYGNKELVKLATNESGTWSSETVIDYTGRPILGQQTSLEIDVNGDAHVSTFRKQATADGGGVIIYATNKDVIAVDEPDPISQDTMLNVSFQIVDPAGVDIPQSTVTITTADDSTSIVRQNDLGFQISGDIGRDVTLEVCVNNSLSAATGVSATDLVKSLRIVLGEVEPCPQNLIAADVNESGNVSATDLVQMLNVIVGKVPSFTGSPSYLFSIGESSGNCHDIKFSEIGSSVIFTGIKKGDLPCNDPPK